MIALVIGRFHAVTRAQAAWLESLKSTSVDRLVCVVTSADHAGTRRNPLDVATREALIRPALERTGKPFELVRLNDIAESEHWVEHVVRGVHEQAHLTLEPAGTQVLSANRDVEALFAARGFTVVSPEVKGLTPHELVQRVVEGRPWQDEASPETKAVFSQPGFVTRLKALFQETLLTDDGELGHQRDFSSYGAQMDASLRQKLDDLVRWVKPGCVIDQGCGTGKLLVELSKLFPQSRFVGVDLSREFLRLCDENTYATEDVSFVSGNVIERHVPEGSATTVVFSSVMHEVHSYTGYDVTQIDRALKNACDSLAPGGHGLIRDGVSPEPARWRVTFLNAATKETFERFAKEFKRGQGVAFERVSADGFEVRLSAHDANEFICKKDYLKNWHIEVHEEFGPLTEGGWVDALRRTGFEPLHVTTTVNEWIVKNRYEGTVRLRDDAGAPLPWPATNVIAVGRKPRRAGAPLE